MIKNIVKLICFVLALVLVIKGATIIGYTGIMLMLAGVIIILAELYLYNRQYI